MKKIIPLSVLLIFFCLSGVSCQKKAERSHGKQDNLNFGNRLMPISSENIFKEEGYYIWDTSMIKGEDGKYHLFYSRWKKEQGFPAWLVFSEIAHAVADSPVGPWQYKGTLLTGRGGKHWDALTAHNPMMKVFDGKYYLYYNATNMGDKKYAEADLIAMGQQGGKHPDWPIIRNNQRIGVAVANAIDGPWVRTDQPLLEPSGPVATMLNNPAVAEKDGTYYMIVKGDKPNEKKFLRNQAMAISKSPTGPFEIQEKAVIDYLDTEDVALWYDSKREHFYAVFHTHGFIGMVSSPDGINWNKASEFKVTPKKILMSDSTYLVPDRVERPFVYVEDNEPKVLALAAKKGSNSFLIFIPISEVSE